MSLELGRVELDRLLALEQKFAKEGLTFDDVLLVPAASSRAAERRLDAHAADARDRARDPDRLGRDGHGHRGAARDRARARRRHRDRPPQPLDRRPGGRGREGQALRVRDDRRAGHAAARRPRRRRARADGALPHLRRADHRRRRPASSASSPTATCASRPTPTQPVSSADDGRATSSPRRSARRSRRRAEILHRHKVEKLPVVDVDGPPLRPDHRQGHPEADRLPARDEGRARPAPRRRGRRRRPGRARAAPRRSSRPSADVLVVDTAHGHSQAVARDGAHAQGAAATSS